MIGTPVLVASEMADHAHDGHDAYAAGDEKDSLGIAMNIAEAAYRSSESGAPVSLPL